MIRRIATENPIWGEERIANELKLKLGIRVSPRTVRKYLHDGGPRRESEPKQRWLSFVRNHAKVIVACDFLVVVTAWTLQQFRQALPGGHPYRFVIHDRDSIFSKELERWRTWASVSCEHPYVRRSKGRQADGTDDAAGLPSVPVDDVRPWLSLTAYNLGYLWRRVPSGPGATEEDRQLVADELAAAAHENGWAPGQACWVLLVVAEREPFDAAAFRCDRAADRRTAAPGQGVLGSSRADPSGLQGRHSGGR